MYFLLQNAKELLPKQTNKQTNKQINKQNLSYILVESSPQHF